MISAEELQEDETPCCGLSGGLDQSCPEGEIGSGGCGDVLRGPHGSVGIASLGEVGSRSVGRSSVLEEETELIQQASRSFPGRSNRE